LGLYKLERYSNEGYLIKVVIMALPGRSLESSPLFGHGLIRIMRSKARGKGKGMGEAGPGSAVALWEV
jgi:hypothetical protein